MSAESFIDSSILIYQPEALDERKPATPARLRSRLCLDGECKVMAVR